MSAKRKTNSEIREQINKIYEENELAGLLQNKNRARSITAGTAFGGTIEVSMRGDYSSLHALMQPVEVVELIEQLAASAGLQVAIRPKQDFASWRGWNANVEDRYWVGSAPWNYTELKEDSNQNLLSPTKEILDDEEEEENILEKQKRRNNKSKKTEEEKTKEELKIQKEIREDSSRDAKSNLEKIRRESKNHLELLRKEIELDMEKTIKDAQKIHDDFLDDIV